MEQTTTPNQLLSSINVNKIIERAKEVLTDPKNVWTKIKSETTSIKEIYIGYIGVLLALGAVVNFVNDVVIGHTFFGVTVRNGFFSGLILAVLMLAVQLASIFIVANVLVKLAPKFEGSTTLDNAFKLVAYGMTASAIGNILMILPVPMISIVALVLGIYGLYTVFNGITPMTGVPEARRIPFIIVSFVISAIIMFILNMVLISPFMAKPSADISFGGQKIDMQKLEGAAKELEKLIPVAPK